MFNVEFLHVIRDFEFERIRAFLPPSGTMLEVGGGTGYQAARFARAGYQVRSIDVPDSIYRDRQEFPVEPYDGRHIPFPDDHFDIVFSSNVLEHVRDLPALHREMLRVLRPGGCCLHVLPTGAWRMWTNVAHYCEAGQRLLGMTRDLVPRGTGREEWTRLRYGAGQMVATAAHYRMVPRHGETGNALTEIFTFSRRHWLKHFRASGYEVDRAEATGLFYTGHMVLGPRLPMSLRRIISGLLGSACVIYRLHPPARAAAAPAAPSDQREEASLMSDEERRARDNDGR